MRYSWICKLVFMLALSTLVLAEDCATKRPSCDPRGATAMEHVYNALGLPDSAVGVEIEDAYGIADKLRIERRQLRLEALAKWARTLKPDEARAYLAVIEFYQDEEREALAEWHTHKQRHEQEAYEKHEAECAAAVKRFNQKHPLPKPPAGFAR